MIDRRTALGASAASLVLLAGCDDHPVSAPRSSPSATAPADPDEALVDDAITAIQDVLKSARGGPFEALHRAHLRALEAKPVRGRVKGPNADLRLTELKLQHRLAGLAGDADSGQLARLLASMSAGIAARLAATGKGGVGF